MNPAKLLVVLLFGALFLPVSSVAKDAQAEAIEKYPELAVEGSELNLAFVQAYQQVMEKDARQFKDPHWAVKMADACVAAKKKADQEKAAKEVQQVELKRFSDPRLQHAMQEASRRLMFASQEDQLKAALLMKFQQSHPGPMSSSEFMILTQESRYIILEYVPSLLPPGLLR